MKENKKIEEFLRLDNKITLKLRKKYVDNKYQI